MMSTILPRRGLLAAVITVALVGSISQHASARAAAKQKLDLNKATAAELEELPGIGTTSAKTIIASRPYKSVEELSNAGISSVEIRRIKELVTVGGVQTS